MTPLLNSPAFRHRERLLSHARRAAQPAKRLYRLLGQDSIDFIAVQTTIAQLLVATKELSDVVDDVMEEVLA